MEEGQSAHHFTKQRIFRLILRMAFRPNEPEGHRQTIAVPVDNQQGKANPKKPRMMFTFAPFLGQGILEPPLGFVTAVTNQVEVPILGRRQGIQGFLDPPLQQQMHVPIARLEHAAKAPGRDLGGGPTGEFFQGLVSREEGLHENQPTQHEAMTAFPDTGHPAKQDRDKQGQIGDRNHSREHRVKGVSDVLSGIVGYL